MAGGALAAEYGPGHPLRAESHLSRLACHVVGVARGVLIPPLRIDGDQAAVTRHDEMVDVASLEADAVHPTPKQVFALSALQLAPGVVLAPGATQVKDRCTIVRKEGGLQQVEVGRGDDCVRHPQGVPAPRSGGPKDHEEEDLECE